MKCCPEEESNEVPDIPMANACADPRAVMIMDLHAHSTSAAMEGPRRSQNLAAVTIRHFVMPVESRHRDLCPIFIKLWWIVLKLS